MRIFIFIIMNNKIKRFCLKIFILFLFLIFGLSNSYTQTNDAAMWFSINVEKKITPLLSAKFSEEIRLNENISELDNYLNDMGVEYELINNVKISANYRFSLKKKLDNSYKNLHRYYFDLSIREKFKPFIILFRTRFQSQYSEMFSSSTGKIPENYSRNKLTVKFDFDKKYSPYIYSELFYSLNNNEGNIIDNMRYCAGVEYKFNRKSALNFFYLIQNEMNVNDPLTEFIVGLKFDFTF